MKRRSTSIALMSLILLSTLCISACDTQNEAFSVNEWIKEINAHRAEKDKEFASSLESPLAGLNRLTAEPGSDNYVYFLGGDFYISPEQKGSALVRLFQENEQWHWEILKGHFIFRQGEAELSDGLFPAGKISGSFDRFTFNFYPLKEKLVILIFDPERNEIKTFDHLIYYPPNPEYRVKARLKKFKQFEEIEMVTSRKLVKTYFRYAEILFEIKGEKKSLMAYKSDVEKNKWLFIPFKDQTSEIETYPAGRFIELTEPVGEEFILDFNLAFNPLCNYADVYNCSYPPFENQLDIAIKAGEKMYPRGH